MTDATPYTRLPDARVLVTSQLADGTTGLASLLVRRQLGAAARHAHVGRRVVQSDVVELGQQCASLAAHGRRAARSSDADAKAATRSALSPTIRSPTSRRIGRRRSRARSRRTTWSPTSRPASLALGDQWRATTRVNVTYGLRLDGTRSATRSRTTRRVDSVFHLRTDHAPREAVAEPARELLSGASATTARRAFPASARRGAFLSGGIGEFRNDLRPGLIAPVVTNTGLPDALGQLLCVGSAVPIPDFATYMTNEGAIPTTLRRRRAVVVRQQPAERLGDRSELPVAAELARQPHAARTVHHEALPLLGRRDVLAQSASAVRRST